MMTIKLIFYTSGIENLLNDKKFTIIVHKAGIFDMDAL